MQPNESVKNTERLFTTLNVDCKTVIESIARILDQIESSNLPSNQKDLLRYNLHLSVFGQPDLLKVVELEPQEFFEWLDFNRENLGRTILRNLLQEWLDKQVGKHIDEFTDIKQFVASLGRIMHVLEMKADCQANSGQCSEFSFLKFDDRTTKGYEKGAFYFQHANAPRRSHGYSAIMPHIKLVESPEDRRYKKSQSRGG